jgi:hypothetical protein
MHHANHFRARDDDASRHLVAAPRSSRRAHIWGSLVRAALADAMIELVNETNGDIRALSGRRRRVQTSAQRKK